ncbi:uncharacterized protein LOC119067179 [Bradysia coprophila]|uniref:uncharacterized protein LOC119067179 n=1 Tax=Bradysia coprophila TaxID=38358 RepID=UPI00187DBDFB|nr:uncharacterized protein LOC119067179 [Bradysia coprophila]
MEYTTSPIDLTYKNILRKFFMADEKLIAQRNERIEKAFQFVVHNTPNRDLSEYLQDVVRNKVASFEITFFKKWRASKCKSVAEFEQQHEKWIHLDLKLPPSITSVNSRETTRDKKGFGQLSDRQKNRRVDEDLNGFDVDQLLLASSKAAQSSNELDLSYVLRLLYHDHNKATILRNLLKEKKQ